MKVNQLNFVLLLFIMSFLTVSCGNSDDEDLAGDWWKASGLDGVARSKAAGFVIDSKFYIGTGYDGDNCLSDFWQYDPATDNWTKMSDFPGVARFSAVGMAIDGKGYIGLGYDKDNALKDFYEFDPSTGEWTQIDDFPGVARYSAVAFSIGNKGYVGTGQDDDNLTYKDFYSYDTTTKTWETITSMRGDKRYNANAFVINGIGYVVSGYSNGYSNEVWAYNPETDTWTEKRKITNYTDESFDDDYSNIARINASTFVMDGKGYLVGGFNGSVLSSTWEYNASSDLWEERTSFEGIARTEAIGFSIGLTGYTVTGRSSSYYMYDLWCFDPTAEYDEYY